MQEVPPRNRCVNHLIGVPVAEEIGVGSMGVVHRIRVNCLSAIMLLALALAVQTGAARAGGIRLGPDSTRVELAGAMEVLRDESRALTLEQVRGEAASRFAALPGNLAAGYDRAAFWLRVTVDNPATRDWFLEVEMPYLDHVELYTPDASGGYRAVRTGDRTSFSTRPVPYRTFVFRLRLPAAGPQVVYLRVQTTSTVAVTARLWAPEAFYQVASAESLAFGLANGAILIIILFTLVQALLTRDGIYSSFLFYIVAAELSFFALSGYASQYLFPDLPRIADGLVGFSACVSIGASLLFVARILDLARHYPRVNRAYVAVGLLTILSSLSVFPDAYAVVMPGPPLVMLISMVSSSYIGIVRSLKGDRVAMCFIAAFSVLMLVVALMALRSLGVMATPSRYDLLGQAAAAAHMLLLNFGLVQRTADIEADRKRLQEWRLEAAQQTERHLESRVALRTAELAETNATLAAEIAERRAAEERLKESERQVRAILDAAPFPMLVAGYPDGRFTYLNQPAFEILNVAPVDLGRFRTENFYIQPGERAAFMEQLATAGCVLGAELRIRRLPREQRWVLLSAVRFFYRDQDSVLICLNDISTRKQLEETLRLANLRSEAALEAERQSMREQRNFLSMVSHEFRVPLAIIEASSQLLGIYTYADDEAAEEVGKIGRAVRRMSDLIDVCLADDRLDSSSLSLNLEQVDLARMVAELCDDKHSFAGGRAVSAIVEGEVTVSGDPTLLRIAISNLIDNALKFSPLDSPVEARVAIDGDGAMVSVTDHGPGITLDEQPRIFEKFFRSTKADRVRGAGLGLYIVRRIIDLHRGCIAVDSTPGAGTTFVVWLPIDPSSDQAIQSTI